MKKISAIITAFKEPKTIGKAIEQIAKQKVCDEILVVAPDDETLEVASKLRSNYSQIKLLKDAGEGKPSALNLAVSKSKGEILILTDGDVYVGDLALKNLLEKMKDAKVGAVSGRPVSVNSKNNKLGFWAHTLSEVANRRREFASENNKRFFVSGYLFAIRKNLFPKIPKNLLSEDGYISHKVYQQGFKIKYSRDSPVYIKYPLNFKDWIIQKKRSAGGYNQIRSILGVEIRSFRKESQGFTDFLKFPTNLLQTVWLAELFLARVYLWLLIYKDINLKKKDHLKIWLRVESTK